MNLAEKLIIKARNYWFKKDGLLLPNPAQTVLIKKFALMFEREEFKQNCQRFTPYQLKRKLIKSARLKVGEMILDLNKN